MFFEPCIVPPAGNAVQRRTERHTGSIHLMTRTAMRSVIESRPLDHRLGSGKERFLV